MELVHSESILKRRDGAGTEGINNRTSYIPVVCSFCPGLIALLQYTFNKFDYIGVIKVDLIGRLVEHCVGGPAIVLLDKEKSIHEHSVNHALCAIATVNVLPLTSKNQLEIGALYMYLLAAPSFYRRLLHDCEKRRCLQFLNKGSGCDSLI